MAVSIQFLSDVVAAKSGVRSLGQEIDGLSKRSLALNANVNKPDFSRLNKVTTKTSVGQVQNLSRSLDDLNKRASMASAGIKTAMAGLAASFAFGSMVNRSMDMQALRTRMEVAVGDVDLAAEAMERVNDLASSTVFATKSLTGAYAGLTLSGNELFTSADNVETALMRISDAVSAVGGNDYDFNEISRAMTRMAGTGKVTLEAIEPLTTAGVPLKKLADEMGLTMPEFFETITDGAMSFDMFYEAFSRWTDLDMSQGGSFGAAAKQAGSLKGALSNVGDAMDQLADTLFNKSGFAAALASMVRAFTTGINLVNLGLQLILPVIQGIGHQVALFGEFVSTLAIAGLGFLASKLFELGASMVDFIGGLFSQLQQVNPLALLQSLAAALPDWVAYAKDQFSTLVSYLGSMFDQPFDLTLAKARSWFTNLILSFGRGLDSVRLWLTTAFEQLFDGLFTTRDDFGKQHLTALGTMVLKTLLPAFKEVGGKVSAMFGEIVRVVTAGAAAVLAVLQPFADAVVAVFQWIADILVWHSVVPDMIKKIVEWFGVLWGYIGPKLSDFGKGVVDFFVGLKDKILGIKLFDLPSGLPKEFMSNAANLVKTFGSTKGTTIGKYLRSLVDELKNFKFTGLKEVGVSIVQGIAGGLNALGSLLARGVEAWAQTISDYSNVFFTGGILLASALASGVMRGLMMKALQGTVFVSLITPLLASDAMQPLITKFVSGFVELLSQSLRGTFETTDVGMIQDEILDQLLVPVNPMDSRLKKYYDGISRILLTVGASLIAAVATQFGASKEAVKGLALQWSGSVGSIFGLAVASVLSPLVRNTLFGLLTFQQLPKGAVSAGGALTRNLVGFYAGMEFGNILIDSLGLDGTTAQIARIASGVAGVAGTNFMLSFFKNSQEQIDAGEGLFNKNGRFLFRALAGGLLGYEAGKFAASGGLDKALGLDMANASDSTKSAVELGSALGGSIVMSLLGALASTIVPSKDGLNKASTKISERLSKVVGSKFGSFSFWAKTFSTFAVGFVFYEALISTLGLEDAGPWTKLGLGIASLVSGGIITGLLSATAKAGLAATTSMASGLMASMKAKLDPGGPARLAHNAAIEAQLSLQQAERARLISQLDQTVPGGRENLRIKGNINGVQNQIDALTSQIIPKPESITKRLSSSVKSGFQRFRSIAGNVIGGSLGGVGAAFVLHYLLGPEEELSHGFRDTLSRALTSGLTVAMMTGKLSASIAGAVGFEVARSWRDPEFRKSIDAFGPAVSTLLNAVGVEVPEFKSLSDSIDAGMKKVFADLGIDPELQTAFSGAMVGILTGGLTLVMANLPRIFVTALKAAVKAWPLILAAIYYEAIQTALTMGPVDLDGNAGFTSWGEGLINGFIEGAQVAAFKASKGPMVSSVIDPIIGALAGLFFSDSIGGGDLVEWFKSIFNNVVSGVMGSLDSLFAWINGWVQKVSDVFAGVGRAIGAIFDYFTGPTLTRTELVEELKRAEEAFAALNAEAEANQKAGTTRWGLTNELIAAADLIEKLKGDLAGLSGPQLDLLKTYTNGLKGIEGKIDVELARDTILKKFNDIETAAGKAPVANWEELGKRLGTATTDGVTDELDGVKKLFDDLPLSLKETLDLAGFVELGQTVGQAFKAGMTSGMSGITVPAPAPTTLASSTPGLGRITNIEFVSGTLPGTTVGPAGMSAVAPKENSWMYNMGSSVAGVFSDGLAEKVRNLGTTIYDFVVPAGDAATDAGTAVEGQTTATRALSKATAEARQREKDLAEYRKDAAKRMKELGKLTEEDYIDAGLTAAENLQSSFSGNFSALLKGDAKPKEALEAFLDDLTGSIIDNFTQGLSQGLFEKFKVGDIFGQLAQGVLGLGNKAGGGSNSAVPSTGTNALSGLLGGKNGLFGGLFDGLKNLFSGFDFGSLLSGFMSFFSGGGSVGGPGTETSDSIPAMLSRNEFVVRARQAKRFRPLLEAINSGVLPKHFAQGGPVSGDKLQLLQGSLAASPATAQTINIGVTGDIRDQTRREVFRMLPELSAALRNSDRNKGIR